MKVANLNVMVIDQSAGNATKEAARANMYQSAVKPRARMSSPAIILTDVANGSLPYTGPPVIDLSPLPLYIEFPQ